MTLKQYRKYLIDEDRVFIRYCFDGNLFNLWWVEASTKTLKQRFLNDAAFVGHLKSTHNDYIDDDDDDVWQEESM